MLFAPWEDRLPNIQFIVHDTKDIAFLDAAASMSSFPICYFPDGSVKDERSAFGIHVATTQRSWNYGNRLIDDTSIFLAEKEALLTCLEMALTHDLPAAVFSDCRSLVQWLWNHQKRKCLLIDSRVAQISRQLVHRRTPITIYWIPGHWGIYGNDQADAIAKEMLDAPKPGAIGRARQNPSALLRAKLAHKAAHRPRLRSHRPQAPDDPKHIYDNPCRFSQQVALWLRTGHSPLAGHQHRVGHGSDPYCQHCPRDVEGRRHFLLECPAYERLRQIWIDPILARVSMPRSNPFAIDCLLHSDNIDGVVKFCMESHRFKRRSQT